MAPITSIEIESFRCFKKLRVEELARVNVIVGANNSGKTVLLEAIEAVVSPNPLLLFRASIERGEFRPRQEAEVGMVDLDLRHWFHGHHLTVGSTFRLRAAGEHDISVSRTIEAVPLNDSAPPFIPGGLRLATERLGALMLRALLEDGWLGPVSLPSSAPPVFARIRRSGS